MKRLRPTPSLAISLLALFFALGGTAVPVNSARPVTACGNGSVKAFAAVNLQGYAGAFPSQFSSADKNFAVRWACNGSAAQVRATSAGVFEIKWPGISSRMVQVSSLAPEAEVTSWTYGSGAYQIHVARNDGTTGNYGFSITVY